MEAVGAMSNGYCEKYLGLPSMVGRSKYNTIGGMKERIWQ